MNGVRRSIAFLSVVAALAVGGVTAAAAPEALAPKAGAAQAEYCPPGERERRQAAVNRYGKQMAAAKKRYFRLVKSRKKRAVFVRKQKAQHAALKRAVQRCD